MTQSTLFAGVLFCFGALYSPAVAEDETLRVFTLLNADCGEMAEILNALSEGQLTMAADQRTNSIVVKGAEESLEVIGALLLKMDEAKTYRPERLAKPNAEDTPEKVEQERIEQERLVTMKRIEQQKLHDQMKLDVESKRSSIEQQLEFLKLQVEMVAAEAKLEQAVMEAEIKAESEKMEALNYRLEVANSRLDSAGGTREEVILLEAARSATVQSIEIQKMKLEFHMKHQAPLRQMEIEMKLHETHRMLRSVNAHR